MKFLSLERIQTITNQLIEQYCQTLDLSNESLELIQFLSPLSNRNLKLQTFLLNNNKIKQLSFSPLLFLEVLDLSFNQIEDLSFQLPFLKLKVFNISNNKLINITNQQNYFPFSLQYLFLNDNSLTSDQVLNIFNNNKFYQILTINITNNSIQSNEIDDLIIETSNSFFFVEQQFNLDQYCKDQVNYLKQNQVSIKPKNNQNIFINSAYQNNQQIQESQVVSQITPVKITNNKTVTFNRQSSQINGQYSKIQPQMQLNQNIQQITPITQNYQQKKYNKIDTNAQQTVNYTINNKQTNQHTQQNKQQLTLQTNDIQLVNNNNQNDIYTQAQLLQNINPIVKSYEDLIKIFEQQNNITFPHPEVQFQTKQEFNQFIKRKLFNLIYQNKMNQKEITNLQKMKNDHDEQFNIGQNKNTHLQKINEQLSDQLNEQQTTNQQISIQLNNNLQQTNQLNAVYKQIIVILNQFSKDQYQNQLIQELDDSSSLVIKRLNSLQQKLQNYSLIKNKKESQYIQVIQQLNHQLIGKTEVQSKDTQIQTEIQSQCHIQIQTTTDIAFKSVQTDNNDDKMQMLDNQKQKQEIQQQQLKLNHELQKQISQQQIQKNQRENYQENDIELIQSKYNQQTRTLPPHNVVKQSINQQLIIDELQQLDLNIPNNNYYSIINVSNDVLQNTKYVDIDLQLNQTMKQQKQPVVKNVANKQQYVINNEIQKSQLVNNEIDSILNKYQSGKYFQFDLTTFKHQ